MAQSGVYTPKSSNVKEIAFDGNLLFVVFNSGKVYRYSGVTERHFTEMTNARSAGKYLNQSIKPNFSAVEIDSAEYTQRTQNLNRLAGGVNVLKIFDFSKYQLKSAVGF